MDFSDFVIYADESGDHSLSKVDAGYPVFVLTLCLFRKSDYIGTVVPAIQKLKFDWFGHDAVVLHEREIRQQTPPFKFLQIRELQTRFMQELSTIIKDSPFTIVAAAIDKQKHRSRYAEPINPYAIALKFCLERVARHLADCGQSSRVTHCIFERRGPLEDRELELAFRRICDGDNFRRQYLSGLDIVFADKRINSTGLQLADLTARPIGLRVLRPDQPNRAYDIIHGKLRQNGHGKVTGWGLKIFP